MPEVSLRLWSCARKSAFSRMRACFFERLVYRLEDDHALQGLCEKVIRPLTHRLDGRLDAPVAGEQNHFRIRADALDLLEQTDAVHPGHSEIGDHQIRGLCAEHLGGGFRVVRHGDVEPLLGDHLLEGLAAAALVVHHQHARPGVVAHASASCATASGSSTMNVAPVPSSLSKRMRPSCSVMICRLSARPRPVPFAFVVKYGVNNFA